MRTTIIGRKVSLRDNFKTLVQKKLSRFDRIFDEDAKAKVVVTLEKNRQTVEITVSSRGMIYRAESTKDEMNDALDEVIDALGGQIRRNKTRLGKRLRSGAIEDIAARYAEEEERGDDAFRIVRTKHFIVKPMDPEEAVLQMNLTGHQFFMFRNQDSGEMNVVYRRNNGDYGLLEPDEEEE